MTFAGKQIELAVLLSKMSQTQKDKHPVFSVICCDC